MGSLSNVVATPDWMYLIGGFSMPPYRPLCRFVRCFIRSGSRKDIAASIVHEIVENHLELRTVIPFEIIEGNRFRELMRIVSPRFNPHFFDLFA